MMKTVLRTHTEAKKHEEKNMGGRIPHTEEKGG